MENVAIQKGIGTRYVYNMPAGFISEYLVERLDTPQRPIVATPYEPPAWIVDQYVGIHQFYVSNGNVMQGQVAQTGTVNAYDIVVSSNDRNQVAANLANNPKTVFTSVMASYGRAIRLAGIVTPDVALTVNVNFPDTSRCVFKFNWDTKQWEYVPGTAVDSNGNSVPESINDFVNGSVGTGEFNFSGGNGTDFEDFVRRAAAYGITIVGGRGRVTCVQVNNGVIQCTVQ